MNLLRKISLIELLNLRSSTYESVCVVSFSRATPVLLTMSAILCRASDLAEPFENNSTWPKIETVHIQTNLEETEACHNPKYRVSTISSCSVASQAAYNSA